MSNKPDDVKFMISSIIKNMSSYQWLFVKNPKKDFKRNRKLTFEDTIKLILSMGGNCLNKELLDYFSYSTYSPTTSAFVQQRNKILYSAFEFMLKELNDSYKDRILYKGYRLFAADGSTLNIAHNPYDSSTYFKNLTNGKGFNLLHLNVIYDLCNKLYIDAIVQPSREYDEYKALINIIDRSQINEPVIIIADRGYESYNMFAHIEKKGWKYLIRVRDIKSNGMASSFNFTKPEFDEIIYRELTRKQTKKIKENPELYKFLPKNSTFDFLGNDKNAVYPMTFRVVRFKISENNFETIITNLDKVKFPSKEIKKMYHMRWGVETSFRELKYSIGLTNFHAKKVEYIIQEVFAKIVMYNFCEMITLNININQKYTKHKYQVNFTVAIQICKYYFKFSENARPPDIEALIRKNVLPIRKNRSDPRKIKFKQAVSFNYRVA